MMGDTDREPDAPDEVPTKAPGTNPMLERILEELRATREAVAALDAKVERGFDDLRAELVKTRSAFRDALGLEVSSINERLDGHEKRLRSLEDRESPQ